VKRTVLMVTTGALEGSEVTEHLGPVSAHFVIGTGVLAGLFSSITDFFGAHSYAYQGKLERIGEEALDLLQAKTIRLGGNAVLGLRIDHDEISGGGKSMLMVTATGTAARIQRSVSSVSSTDTSLNDGGRVSAWDLKVAVDRQRLVDEVKQDSARLLDDDVWRFVVENRMAEIGPAVLRWVGENTDGSVMSTSERGRRLSEYIGVIERDRAVGLLYDHLDSGPHEFFETVSSAIHEHDLLDDSKLILLLESGSDIVRRRALQIATAGFPSYGHEELEALRRIRRAVEDAFQPAATFVRQKGFMKKEKEVWDCSCGKQPLAEHKYCLGCHKDRYGFHSRETPRPPRVVQLLGERIAALERGAFN